MIKSRFVALLVTGLLGSLISDAAKAALVTDFTLTFETSPTNIIGSGTLAISGLTPNASYGAGSSNVTEFDATINSHYVNFLGGFSALEFTNGALTEITAQASTEPGSNPTVTIGPGLGFSYFFNGNPQISESGTVVASAVPELSTWAMMVLGFLGLGLMTYRRRNQASAFVAT